MKRKKTNKTIAGYHLLMILSAIDFRFNSEKDKIIREYLVQEFPFHVNLDREMEIISSLKPEEWEEHYILYCQDFYEDANKEELLDFFNFALQLIKADNIISRNENYYLKILYNQWFKE